MLSYFKIEYRMPYFENKINRLAIRNSETQKAITSGVKKFNEKSWKEFGRWLYSNYFLAKKVLWKTICCLHSKQLSVTNSIKGSARNILMDNNKNLSQWRVFFEDLLNPENALIHGTQVAMAIKRIKSRKAAGKMKSDPRYRKR